MRLAGALLCFAVTLSSAFELGPARRRTAHSFEGQREVLYLPNGTAISLLSLGYKSALAHILWFKTVDYFGRHYASDKNYPWLAHMCELVFSLSPRVPHVYQFCSNMLSWEAGAPAQSVSILTKAIENMPSEWQFKYLRGMTYLFFLNDMEKARDDLVAAAHQPGAHPIVKRLAAKSVAEMGTPSMALEFLDELIAKEHDPIARRALEHRREEIRKRERNDARH